MGKADKLLAAMRRNPLDWRIEQLKTVAEAHGLDWRQPGSSHVTFRHASGAILTVPAKRPIKPIYIKLFIRMLEGLGNDGTET
ncbi:hypothetical protein [Ferrovibrio sp.]|uniref:hypothetical protein n=1 Tax=Ferrovibrio sp. TaxID=1917215 RepID=UPI0025C42843|nr:hypothetical protein [Ferrovibrio sp.]MBX3454824.1 hypothetical protein [Ferrovibrio sp.]